MPGDPGGYRPPQAEATTTLTQGGIVGLYSCPTIGTCIGIWSVRTGKMVRRIAVRLPKGLRQIQTSTSPNLKHLVACGRQSCFIFRLQPGTKTIFPRRRINFTNTKADPMQRVVARDSAFIIGRKSTTEARRMSDAKPIGSIASEGKRITVSQNGARLVLWNELQRVRVFSVGTRGMKEVLRQRKDGRNR